MALDTSAAVKKLAAEKGVDLSIAQSMYDYEQKQPKLPVSTSVIDSAMPGTITSDQYLINRDLDKENAKLTGLGLTATEAAQYDQKKLLEATYTPEQLASMPYYKYVSSRDSDIATTKQGMQTGQIPEPSAGILRPLEEALRTKSNIGKGELGTSKIFEAAGLTGYDTLAQSLSAFSTEQKAKYNSFANMMGTVGDQLNSTYSNTLRNLKQNQDEYDKEITNIQRILQEQKAYEQQLKLIDANTAAQKDLEDWRNQNPTISEQLDMQAAGLKLDSTGKIVELGSMEAAFDLPGHGKWNSGEGEYQCGEGHNIISNGSLGDDYYTAKMNTVTKKTNPQVGNALIIPWGGTKYGHAGTVIGYDPDTNTVQTVEWNHKGDGKRSFESYNLDDLEAKYGKIGWGFNDDQLKPDYASAFVSSSSGPTTQQEIDIINYPTANPTERTAILTRAGQKGYLNELLQYQSGQYDLGPATKYTNAANALIKESADKPRLVKNIADKITAGDIDGAKRLVYNYVEGDMLADEKSKFITQQNMLRWFKAYDTLFQEVNKTGFVTGNTEKLLEKIGQTGDPALASAKAVVAKDLQSYVKGQSGAQFSAQEFTRYADLWPGIEKETDLNQALIKGVYSSVIGDIDAMVANKTGQNITQFKDIMPTDQIPKYFMSATAQGIDYAKKLAIVQKAKSKGLNLDIDKLLKDGYSLEDIQASLNNY